MTNYAVFINTLLAFCGAISIVGGAGVVVLRWIRPALQLKEKVEQLDNKCKELTINLQELTINTQYLCKCTLALMESILSGNNTETLKEVKNELQEFLIKK